MKFPQKDFQFYNACLIMPNSYKDAWVFYFLCMIMTDIIG